MSRKQHLLQGDTRRFEVVADFIIERFSGNVKYIADVAGGQGLLTRILSKKGNFICELIDPRPIALKGINHRKEEFTADMAGFYDLLIGLHPDEAMQELAKSALIKPVVVIPCCNFWSKEKLGTEELLSAVENFYKKSSVSFERVTLDFKGPKNIAIISKPIKLNH
jgi:hypothetical protein